MSRQPGFLFLHSPLVGPTTWQPVAASLHKHDYETMIPHLSDSKEDKRPYWQQHAASVARHVTQWAPNGPYVMVAHSGAGPLLPAVCRALVQTPAGCIFVDAGIPLARHSRLDLMRLQDAAWTERFEAMLRDGGRFPTWSSTALQSHIPEDALRAQFVAEITPRSLDFFTEPLPVFDGWLDLPCAYLKLSDAYEWDAKQASAQGWPVLEKEVGHFYMLKAPQRTQKWILQLVAMLQL